MKHCVRAFGGMNAGNSANIAFIRATIRNGAFASDRQSPGA